MKQIYQSKKRLGEVDLTPYLSKFKYGSDLLSKLQQATIEEYKKKTIILRLCGLTFREIGVLGKVSKERIRQIEAKGLRELKHPKRGIFITTEIIITL